MQYVVVYTTFPNRQVAEKSCEALLEKRLIACANILPDMLSMYHWEGKLEQENEIAVILKTTRDAEGLVYQTLKSIHPYDTPCILTLSIENIHPYYAAWLKNSVKIEAF